MIGMTASIEDTQIRTEIEKIINIIKDLDEPYRLKAFEILFSIKINQLLSKKLIPENVLQNVAHIEGIPADADRETRIRTLASNSGIAIDQLKNVYLFKEDKPSFVVQLQGNETENQLNVSRYLLAAYEDIYGIEWVNIRQDLEDYGLKSLGNLARAFDKNSRIFLKTGQKKNTKYKLTDIGKIETYKMIGELVKNRTA